jgi:murein DD-endopeptidase MepM/ murein hydrolase activator NlpD
MKNTLVALCVLTVTLLFGQTETPDHMAMAARFEKHYNDGAYDSVFNMFSDEMKAALPIDKTKGFFMGLKSQAGNIVKREFFKFENGTFASYKTQFEKATLSVNVSVNKSKINGLFIKPFTGGEPKADAPKLARNTTNLKLPFRGEWTVFWGGDTKELNYHVDHPAQKNAFDILIFDEKGRSYKIDGRANEDYYAFGKELFAPCDGEVVLVVDGVKDNVPGELNPVYIPGNTVIIKTANNEYLFFAHFKQHSIKVAQGQKVKQGQLLGLCGNSGNSSEPHLHFHIQNTENMVGATGAKCYFDKIVVNGQVKSDYSPIKNDKIRNE